MSALVPVATVELQRAVWAGRFVSESQRRDAWFVARCRQMPPLAGYVGITR